MLLREECPIFQCNYWRITTCCDLYINKHNIYMENVIYISIISISSAALLKKKRGNINSNVVNTV